MHVSKPTCPALPGRYRLSTLAAGLLAGALAVAGLVPLATPASADTLYAETVSPVDYATGYPFWYGDSTGLRLELCLDEEQDPLCPVVSDRQDPGAPLSVPENFPDEAFWWAADAIIDDPAGVRARLVMAQEAAFGGTGEVAVGQQVAFSRLRVRIDDLTPGQSYHVTTPYGEDDFVADDRGRIFETDDQGCLMPPCDFTAGLNGTIGPFLTWTGNDAPEGYVGDPLEEHAVAGSPTGTNLFRVAGPDVGGAGVDVIETNLFAVQGRLAQVRGTVDLPGDLYVTGTPLTLSSSFPGESTIHYTTDRSDPTTSGTRSTYATPIELEEGPLTLKFAVEHEGDWSEVYTEVYEGRDDLSTVHATPAPALPPAVNEGRQDVELTAATTTVDPLNNTVTEVPTEGEIYYTTDGTRPRLDAGTMQGSTKRYEDPITITRTTLVRAFSLPDGADAEAGPVSRFHYVIHNLRAVNPVQWWGYPSSLTDIGLPGATPDADRVAPVELELCLDDPLCPVVAELPDPTRGISFPDNFPDESFWWAGEAEFDTPDGIRARLTLAAEAAFDSATPQDGHQIAFGRIRVRIDDLEPLATYEIVHPYGVIRTQTDDRGRLFYTDDNGCMVGPCDGSFDRLLTQPVGPFLRWTEGAPAGYVGDPTAEGGHTVTGSPYGTNEFTVTQVADGDGSPVSVPLGSTDLFSVQGKLAGGPGVMASWQTGLFNHELDVTLTGTHTSQIRYTTDGSTPTATTGQVYDGPIHVGEGVTELTYIGVGGGRTSLPETEVYTVDLTAPQLTASSAGGAFTAPQDVTLTADEPGVTIRFTTDGTDPATAAAQTGPSPVTVRVAESLTLRAVAVDPAGNVGPEVTFAFTITAPPPPPPGGTGGTGGTGTPPADGAAATIGVTLLNTTDGPVDAGRRTVLEGVLAPNGQVLAGVPVVLQARALDGAARVAAPAWVDVATAITAADGSYSFRVKPTRSVEYRVVYKGDATSAAAVSPTQQVDVKAVVRLARPTRRVERGDRFVLRGEIGPTLRGATVVVKLDGPGRARDRVRATVGRGGKWRVTLRAPRATGRWSAKAVWRGDATLLCDASPTRKFRVRR